MMWCAHFRPSIRKREGFEHLEGQVGVRTNEVFNKRQSDHRFVKRCGLCGHGLVVHSAMGRFWFLILVAISAASGHGLWGIFTVILVVCTAVVNAVIWWKYPDYEKGCRIVDLGQA